MYFSILLLEELAVKEKKTEDSGVIDYASKGKKRKATCWPPLSRPFMFSFFSLRSGSDTPLE